ncbi:hypothetical protein [Rhodococcus opacus]|uniref:hypothetical protein n=1 Tax=Rhodococcus opacus TaxID=37919 RepID=UPI002953B38B|nr:hypothetical protein [Rhodococcus opacus]MDV7088659.1 hypothetical protein [Rhodococcus opacus]
MEEVLRKSNPVVQGRFTPVQRSIMYQRGLLSRLTKLPWIPTTKRLVSGQTQGLDCHGQIQFGRVRRLRGPTRGPSHVTESGPEPFFTVVDIRTGSSPSSNATNLTERDSLARLRRPVTHTHSPSSRHAATNMTRAEDNSEINKTPGWIDPQLNRRRIMNQNVFATAASSSAAFTAVG